MEWRTTLDLIRHGEPDGGPRYRGWQDDPLSADGWRQMRASVDGQAPWQLIVSSPLRRCSEFAQELATKHNAPMVVDERLREVGFGSWEGCTAEQIREREPTALQSFYDDPINNRPPDAEPLATFRDRVVCCLQDLLSEHRGKHLLLVCHAGVIRTAISHTLEAPLHTLYRQAVDYASITRLQVTAERPLSVIFQGRLGL
jgi:alpha-ribazole phosphatase/probable phosphoglycerate mutase